MQTADGMHAYGVGKHRHMPEIEQGLTDACGSPVTISFTPHLIPMSRGMQSTIYVQMANGKTADDLRSELQSFYKDEYFVRCVALRSLSEAGTLPLSGLNPCAIAEHWVHVQGAARGWGSPHPACAGVQLQHHHCRTRPHPRAGDPGLGHRQCLQGRVWPGRPEHERDDGLP